ncbi:MAG: hypothetical protein L3J25_05730 [Flavobacteriaceae bacterium]|nr:hypothetical protein [Flavobacteriaceae bacterium]
MKTIKQILAITLLFVVVVSFSQCSSTQKLQEKAPIMMGKVYCQSWIAGVEGGGSGLNIFILVTDNSIVLDSVYFRGKAAKLELKQQDSMFYVGRFISGLNIKKDIIMSNEPYAEYGNEMPKTSIKIPFELKDDECVISYKEGKTTKYFKVDNIVEKDLIPYPNAPPNKQ